MVRWSLALLLVAALAACEDGPLATTVRCANNADCAPSEVCSGGYCVPREPTPAGDAGATPEDARPGDASEAPDRGVELDGAGADATMLPPDSGCAPVAYLGSAAYCTIGEAITAAAPGARVDVVAGRFTESLDLTKNLTLRGAGLGMTTVVGGGVGPAVRVSAGGARIEALSVDGAGQYGLEVTGGLVLAQVQVDHASGAAVRVRNSGASVQLEGVRVTAVGINVDDFGHGLDLGPGTSATVIGSEIADAAYEGILGRNARLVLQSSAVLRSGRLNCDGNQDACRAGLYGWDSSDFTVTDGSRFAESGASGVVAADNTRLLFVASESSDNGRPRAESNGVVVDGISLIDGARGTINDSVLAGNMGYGIACLGSPGTISRNNNTDNGRPNGYEWTNCP